MSQHEAAHFHQLSNPQHPWDGVETEMEPLGSQSNDNQIEDEARESGEEMEMEVITLEGIKSELHAGREKKGKRDLEASGSENENENMDEDLGNVDSGVIMIPRDPEDYITWPQGIKLLSKISWPMVITFVLELMPGFVNVIAVGHLGEIELAAVTLAVMYCTVTGLALGFGLATAMDTLCAQAYGANNKKALGVILQRGLILELILCIPISFFWGFSHQILSLLGQDEKVVDLASLYVWVMMAGVYPFFVYELLKKYLQAQHIVLPQMYVAIVANLWNVLGNWLFVYKLEWGFVGAPIARSSTNCLLPLLTLIYIKYSKHTKETWGGWSKESFYKWKEFLKLGIPGMIMLCLEFWAFEVGAVMAGLLGTTELAAQSIILNVSTLTFFVPFACSVATSVVIGNSLGAGLGNKAKRISRVALAFAVTFEVFAALTIISFKDYIPHLFTDDQNVIELTSAVLPISAAFQLFDGVAGVSGGVMRGCGRQKLGAMTNFVGYYMIGLPTGALLAFKAGIGLMGLWTGIAVALFINSIISSTIVFKTDWPKQVENATERMRKEI